MRLVNSVHKKPFPEMLVLMLGLADLTRLKACLKQSQQHMVQESFHRDLTQA